MKILFLCTAHNSLSQRLYLALSTAHHVTIEYALSDTLMIEAAELSRPDLIICPFLTSKVPKELYERWMTLIIHPGVPGDAGPSALDWVLMGDDGSVEDASKLLEMLDEDVWPRPGRTHWGVTVLQAIEEFDAGPVWAFEQFPLNIDQAGLTKSELYRGPISRAAISATLAAITRIQKASVWNQLTALAPGLSEQEKARPPTPDGKVTPQLKAHQDYRQLSVDAKLPFKGGQTFHRPLLKAGQRDFDVHRHTAQQISRRIRCGDSQPGALSKIFGTPLYVYGGIVDESPGGPNLCAVPGAAPGTIVATRNEAVCISTCDGRGIWITHVRRPKKAKDVALWPKVPAVSGLLELGILDEAQVNKLQWDLPNDWAKSPFPTFQEVWVEFANYGEGRQAAYLYFDFYNGAMSTKQCSHLIEAMDFILSCSTHKNPVRTLVLMGGSYFSNGIALNVIEASSSPAMESWLNINRIDDVVHYLLHEFPSRNILTIAGVRGNAAAGGCALAAACDVVIAGSDVVLNPAYRGIGLHGSEYHSLSYFGRCGAEKATEILRSMTPLSPFEARSIGLVDHVFPGTGGILEKRIRNHVAVVVKSGKPGRILWKARQDVSPASLAHARAVELNEMSKDFYSARASRYNSRRFNFVRKVKTTQTPLRFATHRRFDESCLDEEERDTYDDVKHYERLAEKQLLEQLRRRLESTVQTLRGGERTGLSLSLPEKHVSLSEKNEHMFGCYYTPMEYPGTMMPPSPSSSINSAVIVHPPTRTYVA